MFGRAGQSDYRRVRSRFSVGRVVAYTLVAITGVYIVHNALRLGGDGPGTVGEALHEVLMFAGPALILASVPRHSGPARVAWLLFGLGLLGLAAGETLYLTVYHAAPPFPSWSDAAWLSMYPLAYAGIVALVHSRLSKLTASSWLDGLICGLSVVALVAATIYAPLLQADGQLLTTAISLFYPIGDLALLTGVVTVFVMTGWRPGRAWLWVAAALSLLFVADSIYNIQTVQGTYVSGGIVDVAFPLATLLLARAAWLPAPARIAAPPGERRSLMAPAPCAAVAFGLVALGAFDRLEPAAMVLALAAVALALARAALTVRQHARLLTVVHGEAVTDLLTGLGNRRRPRDDLAGPLAARDSSSALVLYDLDGFKNYNDSFGHAAGDALLARVGRSLREAAAPHGAAYRLGGDEFCILLTAAPEELHGIAANCAEALVQQGEGFVVTASFGLVRLQHEAASFDQALVLADQRMYANKGWGRRADRGESRELLVAVLREREPELYEHTCQVSEYASEVARQLGVGAAEIEQIATAAALHDIGKIAMPDTILSKPGPLDEAEWAFMREHTIAGERIMARSPALRAAGKLVRASHERWDGNGYPDGMAGESTPLGARIIAVCDAYDAMTTDRPYRRAMSVDHALAELRRTAGAQFDPDVVEAFVAVLARPRTVHEPLIRAA